MPVEQRTGFRSIAVFLILLAAVFVLPLPAQESGSEEQRRADERRKAEDLRDFIKATYTKSEQLVPMRDGVKLFVAVYAPKDTSRKYPIWMMRTPYTVGPYGADNYSRQLGPSEQFARSLLPSGITVNVLP